MTNKEIYQAISASTIPTFWDHAPAGTYVPFITYDTSSDNFAADNIVYHKGKNIRIVLYNTTKDEALEKKLEDALDAAGIVWECESLFIQDERVYNTIYTATIP